MYICKSGSEKKQNCSGMAGVKGQINHVNAKHILGDLSCTAEDTKVIKYGSRYYRVTIIDLLEW